MNKIGKQKKKETVQLRKKKKNSGVKQKTKFKICDRKVTNLYMGNKKTTTK
jgi:hypothetical protein